MGEIWDIIKFRIGRFKRFFLFFFAIVLLLLFFIKPILGGVGGYLMKESTLKKADAIFILGGNIYDRPLAAKSLYEEGWAPKLIPMGANFGLDQLAWNGGDEDLCIPDALLMQEFLEQLSVPSKDIIPISEGTSTKEECNAIYTFSQENDYETIIVVSDYFHLRRIHNVFTKQFKNSGIEVILRGARSSNYVEEQWWNYEAGLIMLNNEYVKLMYYMLKGY